MIWKLDEYVYLKKDKYTFKEEKILDGYLKVYCLVAISDGVVHCLLQGYNNFTKDEKDEAIKQYLKNKRRLISFAYANAKPMVSLTKYKIGK